MESNSIKVNLTKDDIISDIILCMGADIQNKNIFMVVEGYDDIRFLQRFLSDNVFLYESYSGKSGVEDIVVNCFASNARVIGVRDRDYQKDKISNKIFYYDYGSLEMMMIKKDNIFRNLCAEYYGGKDTFKELRINILKALKYISAFRMYNEIENWGLNFKGISIVMVWDLDKKKIKDEEVLEKLKQMNENIFQEDMVEKVEKEEERMWDEDDYFNYTHGHDAFKLFALICNENSFMKKGVKFFEIESSCRCAFGDKDFKETKLYYNLNGYAKSFKLEIFCI